MDDNVAEGSGNGPPYNETNYGKYKIFPLPSNLIRPFTRVFFLKIYFFSFPFRGWMVGLVGLLDNMRTRYSVKIFKMYRWWKSTWIMHGSRGRTNGNKILLNSTMRNIERTPVSLGRFPFFLNVRYLFLRAKARRQSDTNRFNVKYESFSNGQLSSKRIGI